MYIVGSLAVPTILVSILLLAGTLAILPMLGRKPVNVAGAGWVFGWILLILALVCLSSVGYEVGVTDKRLLGRLSRWRRLDIPWSEVIELQGTAGWLERRLGLPYGNVVITRRGKRWGLLRNQFALPVAHLDEFMTHARPYVVGLGSPG